MVFEKKTAISHIRIFEADNGSAIIQRLAVKKKAKPMLKKQLNGSQKPLVWNSPRTPKEWVAIQRDAQDYIPA